MLKVLHIGKFFPPATGGIENFLYDLTKYQSLQGAQVSVLVHQHRMTRCRTGTTKQAPYSLGARSGVKIYETPVLGSLLYAPFPPILPGAIKYVIKNERPDIIHAHLPNLSAFGLLARSVKTPIVLHWHSDVVPSDNEKMLKIAYNFYRPFEKALLKKAKIVITTSRPYLETSAPLKAFKNKCRVIPLGVDPERLQTADISPAKPGGFTVCSAGRFTYYKGFEYLIKAIALLKNVHLIISGRGKLFDRYKKLTVEEGVSDRVWLPGELPSQALFGIMKNSDVFCLPSIERTEAFGLVLLEAMYFEKPLITSYIHGSGMTWVNKNEETGLHVPPKDEKALAEAIDFMVSNPPVRKAYGANAKKRLEEHFHIKEICNRIEHIYETIL